MAPHPTTIALPERPPHQHHGNRHQPSGELLFGPEKRRPAKVIGGPSNMTLGLENMERGPSDRRVRPKYYVNPLPQPLVTSQNLWCQAGKP